MPVAAPSLLTQWRVAIRTRHYSPRTEEAYVQWVRRFIRFCGLRHPRELGPSDVTRFLSSLAVDANVSASTQNQALAAIVFLYRDVLNMPVGWLNALVRAKRPGRVPVVFTRDEVRKLFAQLQGRGAPTLVIELLYGSGMRLVEALQLRIKDVDFGGNEITVRGGKGDRDRRAMLPERVQGALLPHLAEVRAQHERHGPCDPPRPRRHVDRKSTRLNSRHLSISYAVFCLEKKNPPYHATITAPGRPPACTPPPPS